MKRILFIILTVFFIGCTHVRMNGSEMYLAVDAFDKVKRINYKSEKIGDYWQTPKETIVYGSGDCEDLSIYLQKLLMERGLKSRIIFGEASRGNKELHAWNEVEIYGEKYILDVTNNIFDKELNVQKIYTNSYILPELSAFEKNSFDLRKRFLKNRLKEEGEKVNIIRYIRR